MKELQAKAKVTQTLTRDGLVVENQADGTVENVSSREANRTTPRMPRARLKKFWNGPRTSRTGIKIKRKRKRQQKQRPPPKVKMVCTVPLPVWN